MFTKRKGVSERASARSDDPVLPSGRWFELAIAQGLEPLEPWLWADQALNGDPWELGMEARLGEGYRIAREMSLQEEALRELVGGLQAAARGTSTAKELLRTHEIFTAILWGEMYRLAKRLLMAPPERAPLDDSGLVTFVPPPTHDDEVVRGVFNWLRRAVRDVINEHLNARSAARSPLEIFEEVYASAHRLYKDTGAGAVRASLESREASIAQS